MLITRNLLLDADITAEELNRFEQLFPNGVELERLLMNERLSIKDLHWLCDNFIFDHALAKLYYDRVCVDETSGKTTYCSDYVENSSYVSYSSHVRDASYVFSSKEIEKSDSVWFGDNVENSSKIFASQFIYNSRSVLNGSNITNSFNVVESNYVINSNSVINSSTVINSFCIGGIGKKVTSNIQNGYFIGNCTNIKNSLFCHDIDNKEFMLFNQPIDKDQYEFVVGQLKNILKDWHPIFLAEEWPEKKFLTRPPNLEYNFSKRYENIPDKFWRWVKTLPQYNPQVLYSLTFQDRCF